MRIVGVILTIALLTLTIYLSSKKDNMVNDIAEGSSAYNKHTDI
jgi:hypothetical protein